ncbi:sterol desaturase family protein [Pseudomonas nitroreducens]|uniref:Sterol desaturase family protein n=1 Tax=Pseudomonas nitroreducens TaxID=46680 RepID=A0A6G6J7H5_PSENT|nr:sterol desaturase family protein [Pseudomonas nitroreducens]QIE91335.1 sterol desaturase family protein [Pseudomonas nitroreducens]
MPHLDTWAVSGLLVLLGSFELLAGRMLNRRQSDELAVDAISLAQFALLIKPAIIAGAALILAQLAPGAAGQLGSVPLWQAVLLVIIPADFMHYWYHRLGHTVPFMWHMHRTHHTATEMSISVAYRENWRWFLFMPDIWYAGALVYLGLGEAVLIAHLIFGCANVLVHSAFAWDKVLYKWRWLVPFTWLLERLVQLPSTHRAHHAELDEHGKPPHHNFAQLLFIWDTLFGTANFTHDRYPERYGIPNDPGDPWCVQLWWPFCRSRKADSEYR